MIRIISGLYKGRRLKLVPSASVRPMQDKVKGALFNIVGDRLRGAVCLDGFAGTGSIGLEALSRGAARCVFVDEFYPAVKVIRDNVAHCGAEEKSVVMHREFNRAVIDLAGEGVRFDVVFLDPPYRLLEERNPLKVLRKRGLLQPGGLIVLRHFFKIEPKLGDFKLERRVDMGDDIMELFTSLPPSPPGKGAPAAAGAPAKKAGPPLPPRRRSPKMGA
ncbi:MAG TPA: 16S rRNA (guanine(966)-N(2))-methyltransferase RsmD [Candidatus Aminicenantes bacterium]|nr:16S rRNA (guanine(966)-N(2))-methyltransferase RsmD [Candidatus Aminicenantes bacterium]HRY64446.1 16S rRNA (guanine(966)-N(2))-methyltransferase RsmD [Candidatus Aminicenantes bacterium]HRZ71359.1 16S rRNA (guanine(966)-N(2))-methyltransferase RsmD [Candidatus Aminicenantes bacterium]